jgi:Helicase HerA, central domain
MRILYKNNTDELVLLAIRSETASKGDYLLIQDDRSNKRMVVQIYNEEYLSSQSLVEDIVKDEMVVASSVENLHDPLEIGKLSRMFRDARLFRAKIRASIDSDDRFSNEVTWIPSRVHSRLNRMKISELDKLVKRTGHYSIHLGYSGRDNEEFEIYAEDLDGKLNIITGRKESGKSHLSKVLIKTLVEHGAFVIIFDLNNEYSGLAWRGQGIPSSIHDQITILEPGAGLGFSLRYCGKAAISSMLKNALDMPSASLREFFRIWDWLENKNTLDIEALGNAINTWNTNELVRDALISRYHAICSSGLFTNALNAHQEELQFENLNLKKDNGLALVLSMAKATPVVRRMIVELVLTKVVELLGKELLPPVFLFAEEAHLYVRDTYWEDIVTRMRHFGIYTTFITNQPDAISDSVYRQVDNIFLFNFANDADLDKISKVSLADNDTVRSIVRTLPQRQCLVIGKVVRDLPMVVNITPADILALGESKTFFKTRSSLQGIHPVA